MDSNTPSYRDFIPDYELLLETLAREKLSFVRINTLRATLEDVRATLPESCSLSPTSLECFYRFEGEDPGKTLAHYLGYYYVQELSAGAVVPVLGPREGELVLDLCAAPGGKTTQISQEMRNTGTLVANDKPHKRLKALHANVYRMGCLNTIVTRWDGTRFPLDWYPEGFDRVLVDAPCTGESNHKTLSPSVRASVAISQLQYGLLARAVRLTRPGGVIVYSTCTFSPIENEGVVSRILEHYPVALERVRVPLPSHPGVEEWSSWKYNPEVKKCARLYNHETGSGGMFIARLRRLEE